MSASAFVAFGVGMFTFVLSVCMMRHIIPN